MKRVRLSTPERTVKIQFNPDEGNEAASREPFTDARFEKASLYWCDDRMVESKGP